MKNSLLAVVIFALSFYEVINAQLSFSGEIRPRTEYNHGFKTLANEGQNASTYTSQRTRLNFSHKTNNIATKIVLQDVRLWGSQPQLVGNEDYAISIHEAWGEAFFTDEFSLRFGRQELVYDDHRILGNVEWAQQARSHDLVLFRYEKEIKIHLGATYHENATITNNNQSDNVNDKVDAYKSMQFLWFNKDIGSSINVSLLFLNDGRKKDSVNINTGEILEEKIKYGQTTGARVVYVKDNFNVLGNFYYQTGKDISDKSINAYEFAIEGSYKLDNNLGFHLGYEQLSGTAYDENEKNKSFNPLYGTNHKFNGFMDYFYVGNHINDVGLRDIYFKLKYTKEKLSLSGDVHLFFSDAEIAPNTNKNLGTELDITASYKLYKDLTFTVGYSILFATSSMEALKEGNKDANNNWAYLMIAFKPNFLQ